MDDLEDAIYALRDERMFLLRLFFIGMLAFIPAGVTYCFMWWDYRAAFVALPIYIICFGFMCIRYQRVRARFHGPSLFPFRWPCQAKKSPSRSADDALRMQGDPNEQKLTIPTELHWTKLAKPIDQQMDMDHSTHKDTAATRKSVTRILNAADEMERDQESGRLVIKAGYLAKQGHLMMKWKIRYFRLLDDRLQYFSEAGGDFLGQILLRESGTMVKAQANPTSNADRKHQFQLYTLSNTTCLAALSEEELVSWVVSIRRCIVITSAEAAGQKKGIIAGRGTGPKQAS